MRPILLSLALLGASFAVSAQSPAADLPLSHRNDIEVAMESKLPPSPFATNDGIENLPDAPSTRTQTATTVGDQSQVPKDELQTKRQMGIMPNFRSVSPGETVPPPTVKERFLTTTEDNFDYSALMFDGIIAAYSESSNATPEFHKGMPGFARYYWHTVADQSVENYFVEFIIPSIRHEETRRQLLEADGIFVEPGGGDEIGRGQTDVQRCGGLRVGDGCLGVDVLLPKQGTHGGQCDAQLGTGHHV
jgi:hypothetical protein